MIKLIIASGFIVFAVPLLGCRDQEAKKIENSKYGMTCENVFRERVGRTITRCENIEIVCYVTATFDSIDCHKKHPAKS